MILLAEFRLMMKRLEEPNNQLNGQPLAEHIAWSEQVQAPTSADDFALETTYVICNSGMRHQAARSVYDRCETALLAGEPTNSLTRAALGLPPVFGHHGKTTAIDDIWLQREKLLNGFLTASDKLAFCEALPFIGKITKYHLAKNFGADVAKPDVHLQRLADLHHTTPQALCDALAKETGYKSRTVDLVIWMACAKGIVDSHTGRFKW